MSSLINENTNFRLSSERLKEALVEITNRLKGRVTAAYIFGSASTGELSAESDIDLILIKDQIDLPFPRRAFEFVDLFEVFPRLDILVYTQSEFDNQLADSGIGFWKSVRLSLKKII